MLKVRREDASSEGEELKAVSQAESFLPAGVVGMERDILSGRQRGAGDCVVRFRRVLGIL